MKEGKGSEQLATPCGPDSPEVLELREGGEADLEDAMSLACAAGGAAMAVWHAGQAAEKYLRALGLTAGRKMPVLWELGRVFEAVKDMAGGEAIAKAVTTIVEAQKERAAGSPLRPQTLRAVLEAARVIRRHVLTTFGVEVSDDGPVLLPREAEEAPPNPDSEAPRVGGVNGGDQPREPKGRTIRTESERRTSYVKVFLLCERCGVKVPRKYQSARGRVPCPLCGRPMVLVS